MPHPEILSQEWREEHVKAGDSLLRSAADERHPTAALVLAARAQAHYAAANVRARPQPTKVTHYVAGSIRPGGTWNDDQP